MSNEQLYFDGVEVSQGAYHDGVAREVPPVRSRVQRPLSDAQHEWPLFELDDSSIVSQSTDPRMESWPRDLGRVAARSVSRIGVLQYAPQSRTMRENVELICNLAESLKSAIVVLPEYFLGEYRTDPMPLAFDVVQEELSPLCKLSLDNELVFVGSLPLGDTEAASNEVVVLDNGHLQRTALAKQMLFGDESRHLLSGETNELLKLNGVAATVRICLDIANPIASREAVSSGARLILSPSTVSVDFLPAIHRARALENQVVSVFCNRCGMSSDGTRYLGRSALYFPDGSGFALDSVAEQLLAVDIDFDHVQGFEKVFSISLQ
ncbi:carbon-nitrogen hydrolase family protein [Pseudonocardia eucalypti]